MQETHIIKFRISTKHRTRKWTHGYNLAMLGARQICGMADQIQSDMRPAIFIINTGMINYHFINTNTNKCNFTNMTTIAICIKTQTIGKNIVCDYKIRHDKAPIQAL